MNFSIDLKRRVVEAYRAKRSGTYEATAALFAVGEASVSRWLKRFRETGDVQSKPKGGNRRREIDLAWLRAHLEAEPDATAPQRIEAWRQHSGKVVSESAMYSALHACGWSHKKRRSSLASATVRKSRPSAKPLPLNSRR